MIPLQPTPRHRTGPELQLRHRAHREHQPNSALTIDPPARTGLCPRHRALARSSPALPQPHSATIHLPRPTTLSTRHMTCLRLRRRRLTCTRPRPRTRTTTIAANTTRTSRLRLLPASTWAASLPAPRHHPRSHPWHPDPRRRRRHPGCARRPPSDRVRRWRFNGGTTDNPFPGKVLCKKCGLFGRVCARAVPAQARPALLDFPLALAILAFPPTSHVSRDAPSQTLFVVLRDTICASHLRIPRH
ncbi:hypothetical protein C8R44DRAFT_260092 [Mycena epipterygia]|nr:hypothetical protein C8R44DRAFT_260092 [Mycena epipterygia]